MATSYYEFTGPCKYARVWPGQIDRKYEVKGDDRGGKWGIIVTLAPEDVKIWNALGTKNKAQRLEDPEKNRTIGDVVFTRNERNKFGDLGSPPVTGVPEGTAIGNDSIVTVKVEVYDFTFNGQSGKGSRLLSVDVVNHVPYEPEKKADLPFDPDSVEPPVH
jgi:hypothetical protein